MRASADAQLQPSQLAASSPLLFLALLLEGDNNQLPGAGMDVSDQSSSSGAGGSRQQEHGGAGGGAAAGGSSTTGSGGGEKNGSGLVNREMGRAACDVPNSLTEHLVSSQAWGHMTKWAVEMCAVALTVAAQP